MSFKLTSSRYIAEYFWPLSDLPFEYHTRPRALDIMHQNLLDITVTLIWGHSFTSHIYPLVLRTCISINLCSRPKSRYSGICSRPFNDHVQNHFQPLVRHRYLPKAGFRLPGCSIYTVSLMSASLLAMYSWLVMWLFAMFLSRES